MIVSQGLWWVFLVLSLVMVHFSYHSSAVNDFGYFVILNTFCELEGSKIQLKTPNKC